MNLCRSDLIVTARKPKSPAALSVPRWLLAGLPVLALLCAALGCENPRHTDKDGHTGTDEQADPDVTLPKIATIEGRSCNLAFAPDGKSLAASGGGPTTVKVFRVPSGEEALTLESEFTVLDSLCFSPDGKSIAAACGWHTQQVKVWDAATGKLRPGIKEDPARYMQTVQFTPDNKSLITTDNRAILKYWSLATGMEEAQFALGAGLYEMSYSPDGKTLAMGDAASTIKLWDVPAKKEVRSWKLDEGFGHLAWSADGKQIATTAAGLGNTVHVWDTASGKDLGEVSKSGVSVTVAFSPKGDLLAVGKKDGSVVVLDGTTYEKLAVLRDDPKPVYFLAFSPDGKVLATATPDPDVPPPAGATKLWDTSKLLERDRKRKP